MYLGYAVETKAGTVTEDAELLEAPGAGRQYVSIIQSNATPQLKAGDEIISQVYVDGEGWGVRDPPSGYVIPCGENNNVNVVVLEGIGGVLYTIRYKEVCKVTTYELLE